MKVELYISSDILKLKGNEIIEKYGMQAGGRAQQVMDKAVIDFSLQYVPAKTWTLAKSAYLATRIGSGVVEYPGPYAHYMYYGKVYGPNIPIFEDDTGIPTRWISKKGEKKHPTGKDLQYRKDTNPLAGPFWVERMKADCMPKIVQEVQNAINGK